MNEWISKWLSPRGCALDLSLQHTHCFQSKQRASAWGISRGWSGLSLFPRPGERAASSSQEGCLASCLYPHTTWGRWKEMLTCCLSLRGLVKPNGMISSQLFNLLRRKEFYEDNNMLSLIREKPAQCSWRVGALILKSFFFLPCKRWLTQLCLPSWCQTFENSLMRMMIVDEGAVRWYTLSAAEFESGLPW